MIEKGTQHSFNCGYLFLQSILADLRIDNMCRNIKNRHKYEFDLKAIFSDLIYSRILYPSSERSSYNFAQSLLEQPKYDLHHIYRSLPILASESDYIQAEVYRNSNFIHKRNTKILYYDCTNYYFEITQEDGDKKYGKGKEHRPNPIIGMGLFMDADGFPLAFDLYPGNQNEQKTLNPLEQKVIRDFGCSEFIYCSDSGLGSQNNKLLNDTNGRAYIITQSLKKLKKEVRSTALDPNQYRKLGSNRFINLNSLDETDKEVYNSIYYKSIPIEGTKISETLIVTYSPKYRAYQAKIRQAQIERAMKMIGKGGKPKRNRKNPNDPARFIRTTAVTENGEAASEIFCELNQEIIDQEAMYDGFYAVTTDLDGDVSEIIAINQRRWQIEECFRIMKTDFEARPVYVRLEECIKAHFLTCFLALLVYRLLEKKLENKYTVETTLDTLRQMNVCELEGYGYIPTYKRTDLTDELHNLFGFRTDTQIIKKQNEKYYQV
ncbi:hypothetical protein HMPREF0983_00594 [Erysipelotrichaceae bacterium 3_1_53]|nr:hypothetical protein HMPREF0983_00594 [Erysipelotrichaceae bacterium 3_1_53]